MGSAGLGTLCLSLALCVVLALGCRYGCMSMEEHPFLAQDHARSVLGMTVPWAVCRAARSKHGGKMAPNTLLAPLHGTRGCAMGWAPPRRTVLSPQRWDLRGEHPDRTVDFGSAAFEESLKPEEFITLEFSKFAQLLASVAPSARAGFLPSAPCASRAKNLVINDPTRRLGLASILSAALQKPPPPRRERAGEGMAVLGELGPGRGGCSVVCCVWFGSYFSSCSCIWSFEAYFPSLAKPAGSPCAAGEHKTSAFKLECSVDKDFKTLASCAVSYGLT